MISQYLFDLLRWQLSGVVMTPVLSMALNGRLSWGTKREWKAVAVSLLWFGRCFSDRFPEV
jgi:hypothetical protein